MSWSLSLRIPDNEPLLERYFVAVGKALCIGSNFEEKCLHVMRVQGIEEAIRKGKDPKAAAGQWADIKRDTSLNNAIQKIASDSSTTEPQETTLHTARKARNFVAHEAAAMGEVWEVPDSEVYARVRRLADKVREIAEGENIVSAWTYEITEGTSAPSSFAAGYVDQVLEWVFGDLHSESLHAAGSNNPPSA